MTKKRLLFGLCLMIGFCLDLTVFHQGGHTAGFGLLVTQILLLVLLDYGTNARIHPISVFFTIISLLLAGQFVIFTNEVVRVINAILLVFINCFLIAYDTGWMQNRHSLEGLLSPLYVPFVALGRVGESLKKFHKPYQTSHFIDRKTLQTVLLSIGGLIVLLLIVVPLLISADAIFGKTIATILRSISFDISWSFVWTIIFGGGIGLLLWAALLGKDSHPTSSDHMSNYSVSSIVVSIIIGGLSVVYILFVVIQFTYLFNGSHELIVHAGFDSYAAYAHRGFYELLAVAGINLTLFFIMNQHKTKKTLTTMMFVILMVCTIIISMSGLYRLYLYIGSYGLSQLRRFVMYGMVMVTVFEGVCLLSLFMRQQISYTAFIVYVLFGSYTLMGWINIDKQIARYNIAHYESVSSSYNDRTYEKYGDLKKKTTLDTAYLFSLSNDAIDEKMYVAKHYMGTCSFKYLYTDSILICDADDCKQKTGGNTKAMNITCVDGVDKQNVLISLQPTHWRYYTWYDVYTERLTHHVVQ